MHGDAVGQFQIVHVRALIFGHALVVKLHAHHVLLRVDGDDEANVAVENALPFLRAEHALLLPLELIVVARLHHLVALAEGGIAARALVFAGSGGVEFRLQKLVEHPYAAFALLGRAEHLHLPDGIEVQEARQAGGAERDDALRRVGRGDGALKEKVAALRVESGRFAAVDAVGVVDDHALFILPEDLGQANRMSRSTLPAPTLGS